MQKLKFCNMVYLKWSLENEIKKIWFFLFQNYFLFLWLKKKRAKKDPLELIFEYYQRVWVKKNKKSFTLKLRGFMQNKKSTFQCIFILTRPEYFIYLFSFSGFFIIKPPSWLYHRNLRKSISYQYFFKTFKKIIYPYRLQVFPQKKYFKDEEELFEFWIGLRETFTSIHKISLNFFEFKKIINTLPFFGNIFFNFSFKRFYGNYRRLLWYLEGILWLRQLIFKNCSKRENLGETKFLLFFFVFRLFFTFFNYLDYKAVKNNKLSFFSFLRYHSRVIILKVNKVQWVTFNLNYFFTWYLQLAFYQFSVKSRFARTLLIRFFDVGASYIKCLFLKNWQEFKKIFKFFLFKCSFQVNLFYKNNNNLSTTHKLIVYFGSFFLQLLKILHLLSFLFHGHFSLFFLNFKKKLFNKFYVLGSLYLWGSVKFFFFFNLIRRFKILIGQIKKRNLSLKVKKRSSLVRFNVFSINARAENYFIFKQYSFLKSKISSAVTLLQLSLLAMKISRVSFFSALFLKNSGFAGVNHSNYQILKNFNFFNFLKFFRKSWFYSVLLQPKKRNSGRHARAPLPFTHSDSVTYTVLKFELSYYCCNRHDYLYSEYLKAEQLHTLSGYYNLMQFVSFLLSFESINFIRKLNLTNPGLVARVQSKFWLSNKLLSNFHFFNYFSFDIFFLLPLISVRFPVVGLTFQFQYDFLLKYQARNPLIVSYGLFDNSLFFFYNNKPFLFYSCFSYLAYNATVTNLIYLRSKKKENLYFWNFSTATKYFNFNVFFKYYYRFSYSLNPNFFLALKRRYRSFFLAFLGLVQKFYPYVVIPRVTLYVFSCVDKYKTGFVNLFKFTLFLQFKNFLDFFFYLCFFYSTLDVGLSSNIGSYVNSKIFEELFYYFYSRKKFKNFIEQNLFQMDLICAQFAVQFWDFFNEYGFRFKIRHFFKYFFFRLILFYYYFINFSFFERLLYQNFFFSFYYLNFQKSRFFQILSYLFFLLQKQIKLFLFKPPLWL